MATRSFLVGIRRTKTLEEANEFQMFDEPSESERGAEGVGAGPVPEAAPPAVVETVKKSFTQRLKQAIRTPASKKKGKVDVKGLVASTTVASPLNSRGSSEFASAMSSPGEIEDCDDNSINSQTGPSLCLLSAPSMTNLEDTPSSPSRVSPNTGRKDRPGRRERSRHGRRRSLSPCKRPKDSDNVDKSARSQRSMKLAMDDMIVNIAAATTMLGSEEEDDVDMDVVDPVTGKKTLSNIPQLPQREGAENSDGGAPQPRKRKSLTLSTKNKSPVVSKSMTNASSSAHARKFPTDLAQADLDSVVSSPRRQGKDNKTGSATPPVQKSTRTFRLLPSSPTDSTKTSGSSKPPKSPQKHSTTECEENQLEESFASAETLKSPPRRGRRANADPSSVPNSPAGIGSTGDSDADNSTQKATRTVISSARTQDDSISPRRKRSERRDRTKTPRRSGDGSPTRRTKSAMRLGRNAEEGEVAGSSRPKSARRSVRKDDDQKKSDHHDENAKVPSEQSPRRRSKRRTSVKEKNERTSDKKEGQKEDEITPSLESPQRRTKRRSSVKEVRADDNKESEQKEIEGTASSMTESPRRRTKSRSSVKEKDDCVIEKEDDEQREIGVASTQQGSPQECTTASNATEGDDTHFVKSEQDEVMDSACLNSQTASSACDAWSRSHQLDRTASPRHHLKERSKVNEEDLVVAASSSGGSKQDAGSKGNKSSLDDLSGMRDGGRRSRRGQCQSVVSNVEAKARRAKALQRRGEEQSEVANQENSEALPETRAKNRVEELKAELKQRRRRSRSRSRTRDSSSRKTSKSPVRYQTPTRHKSSDARRKTRSARHKSASNVRASSAESLSSMLDKNASSRKSKSSAQTVGAGSVAAQLQLPAGLDAGSLHVQYKEYK